MHEGWSIILHGGAKTIEPDQEQGHREGLRLALVPGVLTLSQGGSALKAVELVVRALEDIPCFNAGHSSVANEAGKLELDASIMDGATLDIGAVAGLEGFANPVAVARALLEDKAVLLVGEGARKFALRRGFEADLVPFATAKPRGCDTVGCVARDIHGNLAVATSTGGLEGAREGRVGDVVLPGCGFYADNQRGGVSLSGEGEAIARTMLASAAIAGLHEIEAQEALEKALRLVDRVGGEAGIIGISAAGEVAWCHNSSHFAVALASSTEPDGQIFLQRKKATP
jgi:beta-aspartyl-peptidase (threonine type)